MAKKYRLDTKLTGIDGKPIRVPMARDKDNEVTEWGEKATDLFKLILFNAPLKTQNDSIQGARFYKEIERAVKEFEKDVDAKEEHYLVIEEGVFDWFMPIAEQLTPGAFRFNGNIVYLFFKEGFEKAHEPKEKKEEK